MKIISSSLSLADILLYDTTNFLLCYAKQQPTRIKKPPDVSHYKFERNLIKLT